jgi:hypothetical protein
LPTGFIAGKMFRMICFVLVNGPRHTLRDVQKDRNAPSIRILTYDQVIGRRKLPRATYVFTDIDRLSHSDRELAGRLYLQLRDAGVRVLNNPARVKLRYSLLRALHQAGLNDFNVHAADEIPDTVRFPVFVRRMRGHGAPGTELLQTRGEVEAAVARLVDEGVPREHLVIIEYTGEPIRPGVYRKLGCYRMGSAYPPHVGAHDDQWMVKTGRVGVADEALYQDDQRIVRDNPHATFIEKAFTLAEIEYGRADYGLYRGRPQIFEINTNPHIAWLPDHPSELRHQTIGLVWEKTLAALHGLDSPPGPGITLPDDKLLDRFRNWKRIAYRTRWAI